VELQPPRGTDDLLPPTSDAMLRRYSEAHAIARLHGFRYVETPVFEHTDLFARTSGETSDVVTKEMYTFEDQGGRSVTLRPEGTAPVVRAFLAHAHDLPSPFKAYYVNTAYRHGRPQAGRLREFRIFGTEILGTAAADADVEVIAVGERYLRERGLTQVTLHLNSIGDGVCRPAYRDELVAYFEGHLDELDEDCRARLRSNPLRVFDCKVDGQKDFVLAAPTISERLCEPCATHFADVRRGLDAAGVSYELDPRLVRGLDYYTRTAFEFVSDALGGQQSTLCGGGRYDGLAELLGGASTPGVGFGLGLDRVLLAMEREGIEEEAPTPLGVYAVGIGDGAREAAETLVRDLRDSGIPSAATLEDRPLKAQLRAAERARARFVAVIGPREAEGGTVSLRRLGDRASEEVTLGDVVNWLVERDADLAALVPEPTDEDDG
jgi:histidyl-tRNA synthetase